MFALTRTNKAYRYRSYAGKNELTCAESKVVYAEIKQYVLDKLGGVKVLQLYVV